ncbi:MAG: hypothetical protein IPK19_37430 [Chloroflexi bacterium]|nr:hypothetical protein [Chloroflexota bacterium]
MTLDQRLVEIARQPFIAEAQHFELASWGEAQAVHDEIAAYMASPLTALQSGPLLGGALTLLAGVGLLASLQRRVTSGLALWAGVIALSLLAHPLPWQRYSLPLIPPAVLLAAVGMRYSYAVVRRALWKKDA